jgi:hypothetical protein
MRNQRNCLTAVSAVLSVMLMFGSALAQSAAIDPQAENLLKTATDFLAAQDRFSVVARSTIEAVLASGQKLQFGDQATLFVQRPNKLRVERGGDLVEQVFYYDGASLTLYNPGDHYFATVVAPGTLEEMLDFARESLDIVAPAGDLIYRNAYETLMADVLSAFVVGKSVVEGRRCDHLAFRNREVDWQIWLEEGDRPLPRKLVITSKDVAGMPQFAVLLSGWNLTPTFGGPFFEFVPPQDATAIDFMTLE